MAYQKKEGMRYIGKSQRRILLAMLDKPMTRLGLMDKTKLRDSIVQSALKGLLLKGYVTRDGHHFRITNIIDEKQITDNADPSYDSTPAAVNVPYSWDIQDGSKNG